MIELRSKNKQKAYQSFKLFKFQLILVKQYAPKVPGLEGFQPSVLQSPQPLSKFGSWESEAESPGIKHCNKDCCVGCHEVLRFPIQVCLKTQHFKELIYYLLLKVLIPDSMVAQPKFYTAWSVPYSNKQVNCTSIRHELFKNFLFVFKGPNKDQSQEGKKVAVRED